MLLFMKSPHVLSDLFAQISHSGKISLAERYKFMHAILSQTLNEEERLSIERLLYSFRRGRLKGVEEKAAVL